MADLSIRPVSECRFDVVSLGGMATLINGNIQATSLMPGENVVHHMRVYAAGILPCTDGRNESLPMDQKVSRW